jgi:hypothetical protein
LAVVPVAAAAIHSCCDMLTTASSGHSTGAKGSNLPWATLPTLPADFCGRTCPETYDHSWSFEESPASYRDLAPSTHQQHNSLLRTVLFIKLPRLKSWSVYISTFCNRGIRFSKRHPKRGDISTAVQPAFLLETHFLPGSSPLEPLWRSTL